MDAPDPRTRSKVALQPPSVLAKSTAVRQMILSNVFLVLALHAAKTYLLSPETGVFWVLVRMLACGGTGAAIWLAFSGQWRRKKSIEWSVVGAASFLLFLKQAGLLVALYRLPPTRVLILTQFSSLWFKACIIPTTITRTLAVIAALALSFLADTGFSPHNGGGLLPAYGAIALEAVASGILEHTRGVLLSSLSQPLTTALSMIGALIFSLPLYALRYVLTDAHPSPLVSIKATSLIPYLAFVLLYLAPQTSRTTTQSSSPPQYFLISSGSAFAASIVLGSFVFFSFPRVADFPVAGLLIYGAFPELPDHTSPFAGTSKTVRSYLKSILSNQESRKIFYFLMLNMCYMLVQMLYGVWTNSLGLISDAIHMAFDCMAIAVGLVASVMARWPPNEKFTYGYGRIETLSGFANGIFLILISFFIIFEAIQRILEPPEMNTSQLLLVSSLGLAVNLFGMFAMGGHHHHGGHSHSHGHSHGHGHDSSHSHAAALPVVSHASHDHCNDHSHSHDHAPKLIVLGDTDPHDHSHSHSHSETSHSHSETGHTHGSPELHSHSHAHSHFHDHDSSNDHDHAHDEHDYSHTPSPPRGMSPGNHHKESLRITTSGPLLETSPLTPNYKFGHDDHFDTHDASAHTPNLHDHSHLHEHATEGHSHNMRGVFLHVMADTLGSVGVIISTLLIQFYGWTGFDPIASLFIAVLIAASVFPLVIDTGKVLALDVDDREIVIRDALSELDRVEGLESYSSARFWPKDASSVIGSIHIQVAPSASSYDPSGPSSARKPTYSNVDRTVERVDRLLRSRISGLEELTIQVEGSHMH